MDQQRFQQVEKLSPDALLHGFNRTRISRWFGASVLVHLVVIAATSTMFIYGTFSGWVDPEGAEARQKESEAPGAPGPRSDARDGNAGQPGDASDQMLQEHKDTSVGKDLTETAPADEIPTEPGDLGISLDETNP